MIREALRAILLGDIAVSAAVGGTRIYPLQMPQGERDPSLVYQRVGGIAETTLDGPQTVRETRMQVAAWALDPDGAAALMTLAETRLNGFSGLVPVGDDSPQQTVNIKGIFLDTEFDSYDAQATLYRDGRIFRVVWQSAT